MSEAEAEPVILDLVQRAVVSNDPVASRSSDEEGVKALRTFSLLLSRYSCAV
jgi:hypothetical protein